MGAVFDRAFRKFTDAFEKRADAVYGTKAARPSLARGPKRSGNCA